MLALLRHGGLIESSRGRHGGYALAKAPAEVSLGSVLLVLGEPLFYLDLENDVVKDISFFGLGCAICTASASMMTEQLKGKRPLRRKSYSGNSTAA